MNVSSPDLALDLRPRPSNRGFVLEVRGQTGSEGLSRLREALEEIEQERYGVVELDLRGLSGISPDAVKQILNSAARFDARGVSFTVRPEMALLQLEALRSVLTVLSVGRRDLLEIHRRARTLVLVPELPDEGSERSTTGVAIHTHEMRIREALRAMDEVALQIRSDPLLVVTTDKRAEEEAWRTLGPVAAAGERSDRELQALFLELAGVAPHLSACIEGIVVALARSIASGGMLRRLASERLAAVGSRRPVEPR